VKKWLAVATGAIVAALVITSLPELRRYRRISAM
jgi:hypothetical protein